MKSCSRPGLVFTISLVLTTVGCGTSQPVRNETYYLVATNIKLPYWQSALAGLNRAASQLGVKAKLVGPDTYQPGAQHEEFQHILQQNPHGILISVGDRRLMRADIDQAIAKGIPVFTIDSDAEYSKRLLFIGTDNFKLGTIIGNTVAHTQNGKGNIVVFTMPEQLNLVQRLDGLNAELSKNPRLKVTRIVDMQGDPRVAFDMTKQILDQSAASVDVFVCLEAIACSEVAEVLSRQKVSGKLVIAMDTDPRTLEWIKKGFISATMAQKPFTMAYVGLRMLVDLNQVKLAALDRPWSSSSISPIPTFVDTGVTLVNSENVDRFINEIESAGRTQ